VTDKLPYGGFAATLKGDRLAGFDLNRELDGLVYYSKLLMARIDPVHRHRLYDHMAAQDAYNRAVSPRA
jgi:hypothetical protein